LDYILLGPADSQDAKPSPTHVVHAPTKQVISTHKFSKLPDLPETPEEERDRDSSVQDDDEEEEEDDDEDCSWYEK
jgi:hypothetical protein